MAFNVDLDPNQSVSIGKIKVTFLENKGRRGRLSVVAPPDVKITVNKDFREAKQLTKTM